MVKDDSSETGKSFIFRLYIDTPHIEKLYFPVRSYSGDTACELWRLATSTQMGVIINTSDPLLWDSSCLM